MIHDTAEPDLPNMIILPTWNTSKQSYHRTLRPAVQEAAGRFFVEAVVGSRSFGHLLHDHLGLHVLLCSGIYRDVRPLKTHKHVVRELSPKTGDYAWWLRSYSTSNHI